jgi:hypothetical protein
MPIGSAPTLFTSIPSRLSRPVQGRDFGPAWQVACIQSWKAAGFRIISLNAPEEIAALRSFDPSVEFSEVASGSIRPRINEFFAAIAASGAKSAGIINADCLLIDQGYASRIANHRGVLTIVERFNIDQNTLRPTGHTSFGFDAFFFATEALQAIDWNANWRIGDNWWDYWLPLEFYFAGFEPRTLSGPRLVHLDHHRAWDWQLWETHFFRFFEFLKAHESSLRDEDLEAAMKAVPTIPQTADIHKLGGRIYNWLRSRKPLWTPEDGSIDDLLTGFLNAVASPPTPPTVGRTRTMIRRAADKLRLWPVLDVLGLR